MRERGQHRGVGVYLHFVAVIGSSFKHGQAPVEYTHFWYILPSLLETWMLGGVFSWKELKYQSDKTRVPKDNPPTTY